MYYGTGIGRGGGRGMRGSGSGFGFRGVAPAWPYIGRGRGGLPRCGYLLNNFGVAPQSVSDQELDVLKVQAQALRAQLEQIEAKLRQYDTADKMNS